MLKVALEKSLKLSIDFSSYKSPEKAHSAKKKFWEFLIVNKSIENANFIDFWTVNCLWVNFGKP